MGRKSKEPEKPSNAWQGTYGDMITLMLCFFVMLYNPSEIDPTQLATITQSLQMNETETTNGGMSLSAGKLSDLGNNINSLPAVEKGRSLGLAKKKAVSLFAPDVKSSKIKFVLKGPNGDSKSYLSYSGGIFHIRMVMVKRLERHIV